MKVLLFGWGDNVYVKRHIENVNLKKKVETLLYTLKVGNEDFISFYNQNNIKLINSNLGTDFIYRIPKIRGKVSVFRDMKVLRANGPYDVLHVHFVGQSECEKIELLEGNYEKLILSFWGSDLLRAEKKSLEKLENVIKKANIITLGSKDMVKKFQEKFGNTYNSKIKLVYFPTTVYTKIDEIISSENVYISRGKFSLPNDKYIVVCGYNGSETQNHIEILQNLKNLSPVIKNKLFLVFPMTYGASKKYLDEVKSFIKTIDIEYSILTNYLNEESIARLWRCTDIFVHVQPTDGFSSSMRENLYAGTVVINGAWLKYNELEQEPHYINKVNKIDELATAISHITSNFPTYRKKSEINKNVIEKLFSNKDEYVKWMNLYSK
ncbi:hypothetical protein ACNOIU_03010 [Exiguobacterium mexicanum]|uniref:Glycosyltransferase n=1 Tax=Exiguobacterium mexicanum TaxID=340146 RepID=A0ABT7MMD8_9BACL|nr:hypothetical protein [Exiguobacterium mexicanum]MDL5376355.1 hypothetical protein [Exiguobacterium mexicanum]